MNTILLLGWTSNLAGWTNVNAMAQACRIYDTVIWMEWNEMRRNHSNAFIFNVYRHKSQTFPLNENQKAKSKTHKKQKLKFLKLERFFLLEKHSAILLTNNSGPINLHRLNIKSFNDKKKFCARVSSFLRVYTCKL